MMSWCYRGLFLVWVLGCSSARVSPDNPGKRVEDDAAILFDACERTSDMEFSPDGSYLATAHSGNNVSYSGVALWNYFTGELLYGLSYPALGPDLGSTDVPDGCDNLAFSRNGDLVVAQCPGRHAFTWDARSGRQKPINAAPRGDALIHPQTDEVDLQTALPATLEPLMLAGERSIIAMDCSVILPYDIDHCWHLPLIRVGRFDIIANAWSWVVEVPELATYAISPDNSVVALSTEYGCIRSLDTQTGELLAQWSTCLRPDAGPDCRR